MTFRRLGQLGLLFVALALFGCNGGREAPSKTQVAAINVARSFDSLQFIRAEDVNNPSNTLGFKNASEFDYDVDTYNFHAETVAPDTGAPTRHTFTVTLEGDKNYVFVLTDVPGSNPPAVTHVVASYPDLPASSTNSQAVVVHGGADLPPMDVYLAAPGAVIAGLQPIATLAFGETSAPSTVPNGSYVLTLTAAGDAANVLFTSEEVTLQPALTTVFAIANDGGEGTIPVEAVMLEAGTPSVLLDQNGPAALRVVNAATDAAPRDVSYNSQVLFPAVPFGTMTAYSIITAGTTAPLVVTPAGNPGVIEFTQDLAPDHTRAFTAIVVGDTGAITSVLFADDGRRLPGLGKLRFINAAKQFAALDYFIVTTGTDVSAFTPNAVLVPTPEVSASMSFLQGDFELVLRENGTTNIVAGPIPVHFDERKLYTVLTTNGPDATTATVSLLEDFQ